MIDESYINQLEAQKRSKKLIKNTLWALNTLDKFKPVELITRQDLIRFFKEFNKSPGSLFLFQSIIKKYFTDTGKPDVVEWIKREKPKETLKSDDILTTDDINAMIGATDSHYWKALISYLFETGCRISEAKAIKWQDLHDTDQGMIVHIPTTKTAAGYRKVILPFSSQYLRNLKTYINSKNNEPVFDLSYEHNFKMLKKIAKAAGINKPVNPHMFRHAQATDLVRRGYNEAIIRKKLGWTPTSGMISRYQHLNDEDVINATLENSGKIPQAATPRTEIKEAEKITLVDAAMQFSSLIEENKGLKERMVKMERKQEEFLKFVSKKFPVNNV